MESIHTPASAAHAQLRPGPRRAAVSRVIHGSAEEVSSSSAPACQPARRPSLPNTTSRTTRPLGSMVTTMSLWRATSDGVARACTKHGVKPIRCPSRGVDRIERVIVDALVPRAR